MELICLQLVFGYFNPRSREGSDKVEIAKADGTKISIHAPARGATFLHSLKYCDCKFQSTLPRGERQNQDKGREIQKYFNPRSREGSDHTRHLDSIHTSISIHAPARGATMGCFCMEKYIDQFQSTLPRGERLYIPCSHHCSYRFQSTLPRGERQNIHIAFVAHPNFNPRSREGSD